MPKRNLPDVFVLLGVAAAIALGAALFLDRSAHHPRLVVETPNDLKLVYVHGPRGSAETCRTDAATVANAIRTSCPTCRVTAQECVSSLAPEDSLLLSAQPIPVPSSRLPDGAVAYHSRSEARALAACRAAETATGASQQFRATCFAPNSARALNDARGPRPIDGQGLLRGLALLLLGGLASLFAGWLVVRYERLHASWSHDHVESGPQKFHGAPTPRIGGLCLIAGLFVTGTALIAGDQRSIGVQFAYLSFAALAAFLGGITEDVTKSVGIRSRLALTAVSAACAAWLFEAALQRLDIPGVDAALAWMPLALAFTVFAVSGVTHALNIIDGCNGLAGGYAVMALAAMAAVCAQLGDGFLFLSALAMIGALLGFLAWNYPQGRLFLGDGGAYLTGFWLAQIAVLLVVRHPEVSPWFPLLVLAYPVFETLFSIYRRRLVRGHSPGHPDRLHMHQLIYMRLVRVSIGSSDPGELARRNSQVAPYILAMAACFIVPAVVWWNNTGWLATLTLVYCVCYLWLYARIVRWRSPGWLIRRQARRGGKAV